MPSFRPTTPYSPEIEPTLSEEHKARIQRTMGITPLDYHRMAASRGKSRSVDEDTLSDLYSMGTLFPATVPKAGGITVGQSKAPLMDAPSAAPKAMAPTAMAVRNESPKTPIATQAPKPSVKKMMDIINDKKAKEPTGGLDYLGDSSFLMQKPSELDTPPELKSVATSMPTVATPDMSKMAGSIPKTKSGMKKFMDEYGKFIALGALSGFGGKKGVAAGVAGAALPGIFKLLENLGKKTPGAPAAPASNPSVQVGMAHGGSMVKKSAAAYSKKKMVGGSIRKFSGGSMNTFKYRDGGKPKLPASTLIPDDILFNDTDAAKQMLGRLVYEQNRPSKVKTSPRKYSPREDYQSLPDPDVESMSTKYLEDAPDLGSSSNDRFISGIDERTALPMVGPNRSKRSLEDAIYASAKDSDYDIPVDSIPTGSSVPKTKSGLKKFFSMMGKGLGIKKKSRSNDEGSQSLYAGGAVRKFKGGSMNTLKENLVPQYKKGGNMPKGMPKEMMAMMGKKGKATGDMPEHKKMDMGMPIGKMPDSKKMGMAKPKPSSMDQKFAKGGTARYASGGMCKGYGMAKKIRPTGSMN